VSSNSLLAAATAGLCSRLDASGAYIRTKENPLTEECNKIVCLLGKTPHTETHKVDILVYPFIPTFFPKRRRGQTDFVVRFDNLHGDFSSEIYYRQKHSDTLYKNIETAYARCYDVLTTVIKHIGGSGNLAVRVSIGCFNYRSVPYTVSPKTVQGMPIVEIELHSRFKSDQKDQILPLVNRVMDCI